MTYLKMLRQAHGLSQADLGKRLECPRQKVSMFENGWYAKPPRGLEEGLQAVFGKEWTFARLMESVPTSIKYDRQKTDKASAKRSKQ